MAMIGDGNSLNLISRTNLRSLGAIRPPIGLSFMPRPVDTTSRPIRRQVAVAPDGKAGRSNALPLSDPAPNAEQLTASSTRKVRTSSSSTWTTSRSRDGRRARLRHAADGAVRRGWRCGALMLRAKRSVAQSWKPGNMPASSRWAHARTQATRSSRAGSFAGARRLHRRRKMKAYREWLPRTATKRMRPSVAASVDNIEDYYITPTSWGYASFIEFDETSSARSAHEAHGQQTTVEKVTFAWNATTSSRYCSPVRGSHADGQVDRLSRGRTTRQARRRRDEWGQGGRHFNVQRLHVQRTLGAVAGLVGTIRRIGHRRTLIWGEANGGTNVERRKQLEMRVTVGPTPYGKQAG